MGEVGGRGKKQTWGAEVTMVNDEDAWMTDPFLHPLHNDRSLPKTKRPP